MQLRNINIELRRRKAEGWNRFALSIYMNKNDPIVPNDLNLSYEICEVTAKRISLGQTKPSYRVSVI
jgi:hypothetical protein